MIACIAKNDRGRPLFSALAALNPRYRDLGYATGTQSALRHGFASSVGLDIAQMKRDARFSPQFLASLSNSCSELLRAQSEKVDAVIYWGATNLPFNRAQKSYPYYIISDGPFDPNDDSYPVEWKPKRWATQYLATQREVFSGAVHTFTLSDWARNKIISVHGISPEKVSKVGWGPLGCIGDAIYEVGINKKILLSVGSDWRRKGMDVVAEAGAMIAKEFPDVQTVLMGVPGDLVIKPAPGVLLMPYAVPSTVVHTMMRQRTAFIIAARFDASPHVIYEALQYGTPVIGTNTCGVPEAIDAPNGGWVISKTQIDLLVEAMRQAILTSSPERRLMARKVYDQSGGWAGSAHRIHDVIGRQP